MDPTHRSDRSPIRRGNFCVLCDMYHRENTWDFVDQCAQIVGESTEPVFLSYERPGGDFYRTLKNHGMEISFRNAIAYVRKLNPRTATTVATTPDQTLFETNTEQESVKENTNDPMLLVALEAIELAGHQVTLIDDCVWLIRRKQHVSGNGR